MVILIPGFDAYARVRHICRELLGRYWAGHPAVRNVRMSGGSWLGGVVEAVGNLNDELFVLMLDDYAMCGPARIDLIGLAEQTMDRDRAIGFIPLCWYPARERAHEDKLPRGMVRLRAAPILLQAGIWRASWFLNVAAGIDPRASAWGFEAAATRKLRENSGAAGKICAIDQSSPAWNGGTFIDGFDKRDWALPYHNLMHRGRPAKEHDAFLRGHGFEFPSMGAGDSIAKVAEATGLGAVARAVERVTGRRCGCERRRERLNGWVPYR